MFKSVTITAKLTLLFLLTGIMPLTIVGFLNFNHTVDSITEELRVDLDIYAEMKSKHINTYFDDIKDDVTSLAQMPMIVDTTVELIDLYLAKGTESQEYNSSDAKIRPFLKSYINLHDLHDFFLLSPDGDVIFSMKHGSDFGTNLRTGSHKNTELAKSFHGALTLLETSISEFKQYAASNEPSAFISTPIYNEGVIVGVVAIKIGTEKIYEVMGDFSGLGKTGETVLATKIENQAVFINPLRHDPDAAFKRVVSIGSTLCVPIQKAVQGKSGSGFFYDYRGVEVIAAWRFLPELQLGMVVKQDTSEAYSEVFILRDRTLFFGIIAFFIIIVMALLFSKKISFPIRDLKRATERMAAGEIDVEAKVSTNDEIGELAVSFNIMTSMIKLQTSKLEAELSEHIRTEKKLGFQKFATDEHSIVGTADSAGMLIDVNDKFCESSGYTRDELIGKSSNLLKSGEHPSQFFDEMWQIISNGKTWHGEIKNRKKNGDFYWVQASIVPFLDENGTPYQYISISTDITELKEATQRAEENENKFKSVFDNSFNAIFIADPEEDKILEVSPQACQMLGYSRDELLSLKMSSIHPHELEDLTDFVKKVFDEGKASTENLHCLTKYGNYLSAAISATPVVLDNKMYMLAMVADITERKKAEDELKESEKRHRDLYESMLTGIVYQNASGQIIMANKSAQEIFGLTLEQMQGRTSTDPQWKTIHEDGSDFPGDTHPSMQALKNGKEIKGVVMGIFHPKQEAFRWVIVDAVPQFLEGEEKPFQVFTTLEDVTQRMNAQEELRVAKNKAEEGNKAKSLFLSSMSHELRTPLNTILGFAQLIDADVNSSLDPNQKKSIQHIFNSGRHLLALINDILDLSSIEAGKVSLSIWNISFGRLMQDCCSFLAPTAERFDVEILNEIEGDSPIALKADLIRLKQVFINIITNALKYNRPHGSVRIYVEDLGVDEITISFQDTGKGISPENLEHLFDPFNRLGMETMNIEGTGIGLVITQKLVELMGGSISVTSEVDKGSTFSITLPKGSLEKPQEMEEESLNGIDELQHRKKTTVLYIEDNQANVTLVQLIMKKRPAANLLVATNGKDGIEIAGREKLDLILLDINLPDIDGYEVKKRLENNPDLKDVPIVAVTANAMFEDVQKGKEECFDRYMTKPIDVGEFLNMLDNYLCRKSRGVRKELIFQLPTNNC